MENPYDKGNERGSSILGPTLKFKGELKADEDLLVHGKIEGSIKHSSNLKVGKSGKIYAEVEARYIEVHGAVTGDLTGRKSVVVRDGANVSGNIFSPSVSLHESAKFNGSIDMSGKEAAAQKAPQKQPEKRAEKPAEKVEARKKANAPANDASAAEKKQKAEGKSSADAA